VYERKVERDRCTDSSDYYEGVEEKEAEEWRRRRRRRRRRETGAQPRVTALPRPIQSPGGARRDASPVLEPMRQ